MVTLQIASIALINGIGSNLIGHSNSHLCPVDVVCEEVPGDYWNAKKLVSAGVGYRCLSAFGLHGIDDRFRATS